MIRLMIYSLRGKIKAKKCGLLVIDVNGIGFRVLMGNQKINQLPKEGNLSEVFCYSKINRDSIDIYGFISEEELEFFELLIGINGIGAKAGLKIIDSLNKKDIRQAAEKSDISFFEKIPGIGKKKALRIAFELQGRFLSADDLENKNLLKANSDIEKALRSLGYQKEAIHEAIKSLPKDECSLEKKISLALKHLGKKKK